jgi:TATA-box binding protein (TBP) (component of TFIID and TFIIIB)
VQPEQDYDGIHGEIIEYEPKVFPGRVCRISDPENVFLPFSPRKIILTGGTWTI